MAGQTGRDFLLFFINQHFNRLSNAKYQLAGSIAARVCARPDSSATADGSLF